MITTAYCRIPSWLRAAALFMVLAWAACGPAAMPAQAAETDKATLNFVNADIPEVIRAISHISKKNFLVDPRVKGSVSIVSATPVSSEEAYNILLSALRLQGFAAVETNGVTKIMPEADAKLYIGEVSGGQTRKDQLVTRIFPLQYESAAQLVNVVRPLIAPNNIVVAYPNTNTLVVTDYASNLKRIEQIVRAIDQPASEAPLIIPVLHLSAMDLAQTINRLMQDQAQAASDGSNHFILLADARSNSLLLRSSNRDRIARVRELARSLDIKTGTPGNIHVVYLKNAEATKVAQTLRAVMSGEVTAPAPAGSPAPAATQPATGGMIQADQASNSLIIIAPDAVYNNLRAVLEMLDVRRAQVFVEALIAEVSADKVAKFGIQWQSLTNASGASTASKAFGGTNFGTRGVGGNILDATTNVGSITQGLNIGVVKGQVTIPGVGTVLNLGVLANALETDANANILSTPNLLTLDNEEAKIVIGQNVPFITGQYAQTGNTATATPFQTIDRKDVGLTLRIKPQISEGGTVKLQIYQEVSSVDATSLTNPAGLITNKRSLESSVLVDEGQIIVLGGLIQDTVTTGESRVPLLGSIPLLGALFRYETRQHTKTNLMVFIRPHVLRDKLASTGLTQDRYDYLRLEEAGSQPSWNLILPSMQAPQMPVIDFTKQGQQTDPKTTGAASAVPATASSSGNAPAAEANRPAAEQPPADQSAAEQKTAAPKTMATDTPR